MILPEYRETVFVGETPSGGFPMDFHIITAWNPKRITGFADNIAADEALYELLASRECRYFRLSGCSPDLKHHEEGWGVEGLSRKEAVLIGKQFNQNAIFEVVKGWLSIVGCESGEVQFLGLWSDRLRGVCVKAASAAKSVSHNQ